MPRAQRKSSRVQASRRCKKLVDPNWFLSLGIMLRGGYLGLTSLMQLFRTYNQAIRELYSGGLFIKFKGSSHRFHVPDLETWLTIFNCQKNYGLLPDEDRQMWGFSRQLRTVANMLMCYGHFELAKQFADQYKLEWRRLTCGLFMNGTKALLEKFESAAPDVDIELQIRKKYRYVPIFSTDLVEIYKPIPRLEEEFYIAIESLLLTLIERAFWCRSLVALRWVSKWLCETTDVYMEGPDCGMIQKSYGELMKCLSGPWYLALTTSILECNKTWNPPEAEAIVRPHIRDLHERLRNEAFWN